MQRMSDGAGEGAWWGEAAESEPPATQGGSPWSPAAAPPGPYPPLPAYPPPPEFYRQSPPASGPWTAPPPPSYPGASAAPLPVWGTVAPPAPEGFAPSASTCQWCGAANPANGQRCERCGAALARPDRPDPLAAPSARASRGASPYPVFAPDGRVDPDLMRQTEPGRQTRASTADTAVGLGATLIAIVSKLALLAKFALPLLSALLSLGVYAALFGWQFGLGLVVLLFVHEMGHVVVIRAKGLPASLPIFIPLLGAAVMMRRMPLNARDEADIAIAGPLAGALAGGVCYVLYLQTDLRLWLALAFFSFFLNLFNLVPVSPLDGGRIAGAISKWIWPIGLVLLVVIFFYTFSIIVLIVGWLGFLQTISRFRASAAQEAYYQMPLLSRLYITILYFGLAAVLALAMLDTQHLLAGANIFGG